MHISRGRRGRRGVVGQWLPAGMVAAAVLCSPAAAWGQGDGAPNEKQQGRTAASVLSAEDRAAIVTAVEKSARRERFWGAVLVAQRGEVIVSKGFGKRLPEAEEGAEGSQAINSGTLFELASISKPFTAIAVLQLAKAGKLSLDDPIERFFPEESKAGALPTGITVRHMLSHTTGRDNDSEMPRYDEASRETMLKGFFASKKLREPGKRFDYNNHAYIVLAALVEVVTGKGFEEHMHGAIFGPAGMKATGFLGEKGLDATKTAGRGGGLTMIGHPWGWGYRGCCGIVTTLDDLLAFDKALTGEALLSADQKELMWKGVVTAGERMPGSSVGLGWFVSRDEESGRLRTSHTGGSMGCNASLVRWPREGVVVAVLSGGSGKSAPMAAAIEGAIARAWRKE